MEFDHVIMACHSDTALGILRAGSGEVDGDGKRRSGVTAAEEKILGRFGWSGNVAVLHSDIRVEFFFPFLLWRVWIRADGSYLVLGI